MRVDETRADHACVRKIDDLPFTGVTYLAVTRIDDGGSHRYQARRDNDASGGDAAGGYLYISDDQPWPPTLEQVLVDGPAPHSWLRYDPAESQIVDPGKAKALPRPA